MCARLWFRQGGSKPGPCSERCARFVRGIAQSSPGRWCGAIPIHRGGNGGLRWSLTWVWWLPGSCSDSSKVPPFMWCYLCAPSCWRSSAAIFQDSPAALHTVIPTRGLRGVNTAEGGETGERSEFKGGAA